MRYPIRWRRDENGTLVVEVPDVPGVLTVAVDEADAVRQAQDALVTMLAQLMAEGEPIPPPSRPKRGQAAVALPALVTTKLAIYEAMRRAGVTQAALAERLGCDARQVRRLLDLDHASTLRQLEAALEALGKELVVEVRDAA
jgi:antitoxin HicB